MSTPEDLAYGRGRIAGSVNALPVPPSDLLWRSVKEAWLSGYTAEITKPSVERELAQYPKQLAVRRRRW